MAAGLNIRAERVDAFREAFNRHIRAAAVDELFQPALDLAGVFVPGEVGRPLFEHLARLSPFGRNHPEPIFIFEPISYLRPPRAFGRDHIKLFLSGEGNAELEAVGFGLARHDWSRPPARLAAVLDWDDYRDRVNLRIIDWMR
jgi:single-stranded-DNA-specific exonuclease